MAEDAADRLHAAVDSILVRGKLGDVTASRLRRAIGELVGQGDSGKATVVRHYQRVLAAMNAGDLDGDVASRVTELLMAGWGNPNTSKAVRRPASRQVSRTSKSRELRRVPNGTVVTYDGISATIRDGRITLEGRRGTFEAVTPAAKAVTGQESVNGWQAWRVADGRTLGDAYDTGAW